MAEDPYLYPGTWVLRNLRNIRDIDELARFEAKTSAGRLTQLAERPVVGKFNRTHLQAIHRYIFQDVYEWAGKLRTVDIRKEDSFYFARVEFIRPSLDELFGKLDRKGGLHGLDTRSFAERAGDLLGEINAIHPFREGNGRAQQEFIRELAARTGHELSWANVSRDAMYRASALSFANGDSSGLATLIYGALVSQNR